MSESEQSILYTLIIIIMTHTHPSEYIVNKFVYRTASDDDDSTYIMKCERPNENVCKQRARSIAYNNDHRICVCGRAKFKYIMKLYTLLSRKRETHWRNPYIRNSIILYKDSMLATSSSYCTSCFSSTSSRHFFASIPIQQCDDIMIKIDLHYK